MTEVMVIQGRKLHAGDIGLIRSLPAYFGAACSRRLEPVDTFIRDLAAKTEVTGFDETCVRATGSLHWLHTVSPRWLSWHFAHKQRTREIMDAANILPGFRGRAVHEFRDFYLKYDCNHAFANAHLLRELIFLWEEQDQMWDKPMIDHRYRPRHPAPRLSGSPLHPRRLYLVATLPRWPAPPLRIMPSIWTNYRLAKILLIL